MISIDESLDVAAAPDAVFGVVARVERYPAWIPGVVSARALPGPAEGSPGARFRLGSAGPMGRMEADGEVTAAEPPRSIAIRATSPAFRLSATCRVEPLDAGSRLRVTAELELAGFARFLEGEARSRVTAGIPGALERLKVAIEGEAGRPAS